MNAKHKPTPQGERVQLRPIGPQDAKAMCLAMLDPESRRLNGTQAAFGKAASTSPSPRPAPTNSWARQC
ncbi:MAG TPA: hypothetical protein VF171_00545 [Trueperaceae bacterium]